MRGIAVREVDVVLGGDSAQGSELLLELRRGSGHQQGLQKQEDTIKFKAQLILTMIIPNLSPPNPPATRTKTNSAGK